LGEKEALQKIIDKIDWEGGLVEAFVDYGLKVDPKEFPELSHEAEKFKNAYEDLMSELYSLEEEHILGEDE
jgi:hypothetical protein